MFGAATTLVAESVPGQFRALALGSLQALSATGNIIGSLISLQVQPGAQAVWGQYAGWRVLFFVGILPALLVIPIVFVLKEPEAWLRARAEAARGARRKSRRIAARAVPRSALAPQHARRPVARRVRHDRTLGHRLLLARADLDRPSRRAAARRRYRARLGTRVPGHGRVRRDDPFTAVAAFLSRRLAFLGALLLSMGVTMFVFGNLKSASDAYWMLPMMGFAQLAVFAGYSIYFPELFPTRLRGTGVGFCYNTVRYLAAPAPILFGYLATLMSFRTAGMLMSAVYLVGIVALIWAPETKGQPLPDD